jgi:carbonic anhydrase
VERLQKIGKGEKVYEPWIIETNPAQLGIPIVSGLEPSHAPYALVLGCSDARVPVEHVFDCSANDLFVVRVAGNVLGLECLGSVDYAVTQLRSIQSVLVMGHSGCGAVHAAVEIYMNPTQFSSIAFSHPLRSLLDRVMLSVRGSAKALELVKGAKVTKHKKYREWLETTSVYLNAAVTAFDLQREVNFVAKGTNVSFTIYDMGFTRISSLPLTEADCHLATEPFAAAPKEIDEFSNYAERVVSRLQ